MVEVIKVFHSVQHISLRIEEIAIKVMIILLPSCRQSCKVLVFKVIYLDMVVSQTKRNLIKLVFVTGKIHATYEDI